MKITNIKNIVVYYEKNGVSCLYPSDDNKHYRTELRVNGIHKTHRTSTFVFDGVIEKVESVETNYIVEYFLNDKIIEKDELESIKYKFFVDNMKSYGKVYYKEIDIDDEDEEYRAYYLLTNKAFNDKFNVSTKPRTEFIYEDITNNYSFHTVDNIEYDTYISTILASNIEFPNFDKGLYQVSFISIYRDYVKNFCDENGLTYDFSTVGKVGEYDKINDIYCNKILTQPKLGFNQYITYEDALKAKNSYVHTLLKDLRLFIAEKINDVTVIKIISSIEHIKNIISYSDVKKSSEYKCSAYKNQLNDLVKLIKGSYDLQEK